jgi:hypothetical protein
VTGTMRAPMRSSGPWAGKVAECGLSILVAIDTAKRDASETHRQELVKAQKREGAMERRMRHSKVAT